MTSDSLAIVCGSLAGIAGKFVEYPFDTIKVRLQAQPADRQWFQGPWDCLRTTLRQEGVYGLYRGVSSPLVGAMLENSVLFYTYGYFQRVLQDTFGIATLKHKANTVTDSRTVCLQQTLPLRYLACAGGLAGVCAAVVLTPVELVKCRMQVQMVGRYDRVASQALPAHATDAPKARAPAGPLQTVALIFKAQGLGGFFQGFAPTLLREVGGGMAWFGAYETVCHYFLRRRQTQLLDARHPADALDTSYTLSKDDLNVLELTAAGASAGIAYNIVLYPVDVVKSQIQTSGELQASRHQPTHSNVSKVAPPSTNTSMWRIGRALYAGGGIKALYRGCGITLLRAAPSNAVLFVSYVSAPTFEG
ncbi:mitochondrial ornithine carrier protein [Dimargaris verticillata]|uniref:Mitochondrial ornithine carrier protein n=1 Tax=Dimargaris verticillata TaxID=2761393 RepID=A0A9W8BBP7_9FUNG|nr:mitochondrial ornithine carrier protein [Dimargaris verticillata]